MPSTRRCVFGCLTVGVTIHRFPSPTKFPKRFRLWVDLAKDSLQNITDDDIYKYKRVCNIHFTDNVHTRHNRLSALAIPTLNLPGPSKSQGTNTNHAETSGATADARRACNDDDDDDDDDDDNVRKDIRLGLRLYSDKTNNEENKHCLSTLYTNYVASDTENNDGIEDSDIIMGLGSKSVGTSGSGLFSWNKNSDVIPEVGEEDDVVYEVIGDTEENLPEQENNDKLKDGNTKDVPEKSEHVGFQCNCCKKSIVDYRYSCVQCEDYDLCSRCEWRGVHALHYMLRVPRPRPYEEVQSMLQLIRRQLFQSDILFNLGDPDIVTPFSKESIKLEPKDEVEEVDPFESTTRPATVSPLFGRTKELEDTGQENVNEMDTESAVDLPSDNVPSRIKSRHSRRTYMPRKRKLQDSDESDGESTIDILLENVPEEYTLSDGTQDINESDQEKIDLPSASIATNPTWSKHPKHILYKINIQDSDDSDKESTLDILSENVPIKHIFSDKQTYVPHETITQDTDESDEECRKDSPSANVATKLTYWNRPVKLQDSNKKSTKDLLSENVLSNPRFRVRKHFPPKRKTQQQITENYGIQYNDAKNPKVVLSRLPLELVKNQKLIESDGTSTDSPKNDELRVDNMPDVALTDNLKSNDRHGSMLVTPDHLGLSEMDIRKMFNLGAQDRKRIFIRIEKRNEQSQLPQPARVTLPQKRLGKR